MATLSARIESTAACRLYIASERLLQGDSEAARENIENIMNRTVFSHTLKIHRTFIQLPFLRKIFTRQVAFCAALGQLIEALIFFEFKCEITKKKFKEKIVKNRENPVNRVKF